MQPSRQNISHVSPGRVVPSGRIVDLVAPAAELGLRSQSAGLEVVGSLAAEYRESHGLAAHAPVFRPIGSLHIEAPVARVVMSKDLQKWWDRLDTLARSGSIPPVGLGFPPQFMEVRSWGREIAAVDFLSLLANPDYRGSRAAVMGLFVVSDFVVESLKDRYPTVFRNIDVHVIPKDSLTDVRSAWICFREAFEHAHDREDMALAGAPVARWKSQLPAAA